MEKQLDRQLHPQALIALVVGLCLVPVAPVVAATDYSCVQACLAHGRLYQDCVARCTSAPPVPGAPQNLPATPAPVVPQTAPVPVAPSTTTAPGTMQVPPLPPATRTVQPPAAAPAQRPTLAPATPSAPTPTTQHAVSPKKPPPAQPVLNTNGTCLARCKDRGHLYDYCKKVCIE